MQVVGDELIPLGKVKDFAPYITKIKASGAQALLTGNWGPDMNLLIKAGIDAGVDLRYYTMYAHLAGGPTAIGPAGDGKVFSVMSLRRERGARDRQQGSRSLDGRRSATSTTSTSRRRASAPSSSTCRQAINKAGSVDPTKIAFALEGLQHKDFIGYDTVMRKDDHQIIGRVLRRRVQEGREVRIGEDRPRLEDRRDRAGQGLRTSRPPAR